MSAFCTPSRRHLIIAVLIISCSIHHHSDHHHHHHHDALPPLELIPHPFFLELHPVTPLSSSNYWNLQFSAPPEYGEDPFHAEAQGRQEGRRRDQSDYRGRRLRVGRRTAEANQGTQGAQQDEEEKLESQEVSSSEMRNRMR